MNDSADAPSNSTPAHPPETATFDCPRCGGEVTERFWGPCESCRQELNRIAAGSNPQGSTAQDPAEFEPTKFEPAMHVTPNHVATKD